MYYSFLEALSKGDHILNYRVILVSEESPQYGVGIRFNKTEGLPVKEILLLRSADGLPIVQGKSKIDVITTLSEIPEPSYALAANLIGIVDKWIQGIVVNIKDLESLSNIGNIKVTCKQP